MNQARAQIARMNLTILAMQRRRPKRTYRPRAVAGIEALKVQYMKHFTPAAVALLQSTPHARFYCS